MAYKASDIAAALIEAQGMITHAARRIGCSRTTIYSAIKRHPSVKEAFEDARATLGDRIETTLLTEALGTRKSDGTYKREPNITALIFLAKTHPAMRERGYAERYEHTGKDGGPLEQRTVNVNVNAENEHHAADILSQLAGLGAIPSRTSENGHEPDTD